MMIKSLKVDLEGYLYLQEQCRLQRLGEKLTDNQIKRLTRNYYNNYPNGVNLTNGQLGGAKDNKWISWTIEDMKNLLDKAGLQYELSEVDEINVKHSII